MYGAVNSILSRMGSLTETINEAQQLKSNMTKMDSSIRTLNQRLVNSNATCANKDPIGEPLVRKTQLAAVDTTESSEHHSTPECNDVTCMTTKHTNAGASVTIDDETIQIQFGDEVTSRFCNAYKKGEKCANEEKRQDPIDSNNWQATGNSTSNNPESTISAKNQERETSNGFRAARRKRVTSYFIGNIDSDVYKKDIYQYMTWKRVKPTQINMYYGKSGAAAKVNVFMDDEALVESDDFWPEDIVCRKWVSKTEWERERERNRGRYKKPHAINHHKAARHARPNYRYDDRNEARHSNSHDYLHDDRYDDRHESSGRSRHSKNWEDNDYDSVRDYYSQDDF